ncbi:nuclear transport factor 2 family protein [Streptomyces sp. NBC_00076]|uniref:nuclear transport factor 2 family protein n=1 Tax=Streptomyces sp. NBC_00076 TaxID=2975642 RepID=UPI003247F6D3
MTPTLEDRLAVHELIALYGHLVDAGELERSAEVFTTDVVYDLSDFGQGEVVGLAALMKAALARGARNPVAHHVTDVVIEGRTADGGLRVRSKGLGVMSDGSCGSVTYEDLVVRVADGWRISRRRVVARRVPLNGLGQA